MKSIYSLFVLIVFVFGAFINNSYAQYPVSGHVYFADNGLPVTSGYVNAYRVSDASLIAQTQINPDGSYAFASLNGELTDVIGPVNDEWGTDAPVPTYYPTKLDWINATQILPNQPLNNIDIYAKRVSGLPGGNANSVATISGNVTLDNKGLSDAIIYLKKGELIAAFGMTDSKGNFNIKNVPVGDYILAAHRLRFNASSINISLTGDGLKNINIPLEIAKQALTVEPNTFSLSQNYPNPFNPVTKISYSVAKDGLVKLAVYDINGQLVKQLINENKQTGSYTIEFDGTNLASGVYFYKLSAGNFVGTKRLTLIK